jgi:hypothetical protein
VHDATTGGPLAHFQSSSSSRDIESVLKLGRL